MSIEEKNNYKCVIVIPIYKDTLSQSEICAVDQCQKILFKHTIFFIAPKSLATNFYKKKFPFISFVFFDDSYFKNIKSYSKLLMSYNFYSKFNPFTHMLVYQTDAWVFKDELLYWCDQQYDFIGAPSLETNANNDIVFQNMFNGGFSLRNIKTCMKALTSFSYLARPKEVIRYRFIANQSYRLIIKNIIGLILDLTIRNNTFFMFNNFYWHEDGFWSNLIPQRFKWFKVPITYTIAAHFAFENRPDFLFQLTADKLPFGCHGWTRYNQDFYAKLISCK
jgi:hypothetical protein